MPKLHELLAVRENLKGQAGKARADLLKTFTDKRHLFTESRITYKPFEEGAAETVESQSSIQTTVVTELEWVTKIVSKYWDTDHQIDTANGTAKADVLDEDTGAILLKAVPAPSLLQLEKRLNEFHELIVSIPTLDPAKGFKPDATMGKHLYKALDVDKPRTKKVFTPLVLAAATKEHPAQVKEGWEDKPIGKLHAQEWSSLITPATKAELLERCDKLVRAVKKARAKANEHEIDTKSSAIAKTLLDYVLQPLQDTAA